MLSGLGCGSLLACPSTGSGTGWGCSGNGVSAGAPLPVTELVEVLTSTLRQAQRPDGCRWSWTLPRAPFDRLRDRRGCSETGVSAGAPLPVTELVEVLTSALRQAQGPDGCRWSWTLPRAPFDKLRDRRGLLADRGCSGNCLGPRACRRATCSRAIHRPMSAFTTSTAAGPSSDGWPAHCPPVTDISVSGSTTVVTITAATPVSTVEL